MRLASFIVWLAVGCGQERLRLNLPDSGSPSSALDSLDGSLGEQGASSARNQAGSSSSNAGGSAGGFGGYGGQGAGFSTAGSAAQGSASQFPTPLFTVDPLGYEGSTQNEPPWCAQGQSFAEVCGNDLDEDCDHTVDELAELGQPCSDGCGQGSYGCDRTTHTVICRGGLACENSRAGLCGDGFVDVGEQCDPMAPGEDPGVTCLETCMRPSPQFVACLDERGQAISRLCAAGWEVCSEHVGACVPVTGPEQRLCPELHVAGSTDPDAIYPTLEVIETGECWISCGEDADCPPAVLTDCYMGVCVVPL